VNTSALLGMAVLEHLGVYYMPGISYVGFADDGILAGEEAGLLEQLAALLQTETSGVALKPEKCKEIKSNGFWLSSLKLVGARYVPETDSLEAATRNGNTATMTMGGSHPTRATSTEQNPFAASGTGLNPPHRWTFAVPWHQEKYFNE
jgi:hypothetical protein